MLEKIIHKFFGSKPETPVPQSPPIMDRPIIFSDESIVQILLDRKTQTRRALRKQPKFSICPLPASPSGYAYTEADDQPKRHVPGCPYGKVGDRLWVREWWTTEHRAFDGEPSENFRAQVTSHSERLYYRSDSPDIRDSRYWRNPIFMPRWASRRELEITAVRLERRHDISCADVLAEGCHGSDWHEYAELWDHLNARRGFDWESNPWVWVLEFRRV